MDGNVTIDVHLDDRDPVPPVQAANGGIRITVGDRVLTAVEDSDGCDGGTPWSPEHVGLHLRLDLGNLAEVATAVRGGDLDRYEVQEADLEATPQSVAVERFSGSGLRLAFRSGSDGASDRPTLPPAAECGYPASSEAFCEAVATANREFLSALAAAGADTDHHSLQRHRDIARPLRGSE